MIFDIILLVEAVLAVLAISELTSCNVGIAFNDNNRFDDGDDGDINAFVPKAKTIARTNDNIIDNFSMMKERSESE